MELSYCSTCKPSSVERRSGDSLPVVRSRGSKLAVARSSDAKTRPALVKLPCKCHQPKNRLHSTFQEFCITIRPIPQLKTMSLNTKPLCKAALSLSRRHANAASIRRKSNQAYPFTKPSSNSSMPRVTTADTAAKVAYPFTKPSAPTKIASPTNPVERPGPSQDDSAVISREAQDDSDAHRPDYIHGADYRTSYVVLNGWAC